jgi:hypothetical protein
MNIKIVDRRPNEFQKLKWEITKYLWKIQKVIYLKVKFNLYKQSFPIIKI